MAPYSGESVEAVERRSQGRASGGAERTRCCYFPNTGSITSFSEM